MTPTRTSTIIEMNQDNFYLFMNGEIDRIEGIKSVEEKYTEWGTVIAKIYFKDLDSKMKYLESK